MKTSSYSGFFKLDTEARMREVAEFAGLSQNRKFSEARILWTWTRRITW